MSNTTTVPRYSYDSDPQPVFRVPPRETPIWRYMELSKLLLLLESRRLFVCRVSKFEDDPFEGSVTQAFDATLREWEASVGMSPEASANYRAERPGREPTSW